MFRRGEVYRVNYARLIRAFSSEADFEYTLASLQSRRQFELPSQADAPVWNAEITFADEVPQKIKLYLPEAEQAFFESYFSLFPNLYFLLPILRLAGEQICEWSDPIETPVPDSKDLPPPLESQADFPGFSQPPEVSTSTNMNVAENPGNLTQTDNEMEVEPAWW